MNFAETCNRIFWNTTQYYHRFDQVDASLENPYSEGSIEYYLWFSGIWRILFAIPR